MSPFEFLLIAQRQHARVRELGARGGHPSMPRYKMGIAELGNGRTKVPKRLLRPGAVVRLVEFRKAINLPRTDSLAINCPGPAMQKLSVFVSSTSKDLAEFREAVVRSIRAVHALDPINQENIGLLPAAPLSICIELVKQCDLFAGIFGHYRGWEPPADPKNRSITEIEYDTAVEQQKPIFVVLAPADFPVPANLVGTDQQRQRQKAFVERVAAEHVVSFDLSNPDKTANVVVTSLFNHLISSKLITLAKETDPTVASSDVSEIPRVVEKVAFLVVLDYDQLLRFPRAPFLSHLEKALLRASEGALRDKRTDIFETLGDIFFLIEYERSSKYYLKVVAIDPSRQHALNRLGLLADRKGKPRDALEFYNRAIEVAGEHSPAFRQLILNAAAAHSSIGNLPKAESLCIRALALARADHDPKTEASAYSCLGNVHWRRGNVSLAIEYTNKALKLENELGNFEGASHDLNSLAAYYCGSGEYEKAVEYGERSLSFNRKIGRIDGEGIANWHLFIAEKKLGKDTAIPYAREAIRCFTASDQPTRIVMAWEGLAIAYVDKDCWADAADCFATAAKQSRKLGSTADAVRSGMLAGLCRFEFDSERDGIVACEKALAYGLRRARTKEELGDSFWGYVAQLVRKDKSEAIASLRKIDKWAAKHAPVLRARIGSAIGQLYLEKKEFDNALIEFERIDQQKLVFEDDRETAVFLGNFGIALTFRGHAERAYETLKRSVAIFEALGDKRGLANNYTNLAVAGISLGKLEEAEHYTELAIQNEKECGTLGIHEADFINKAKIDAITRAIGERPLGPD